MSHSAIQTADSVLNTLMGFALNSPDISTSNSSRRMPDTSGRTTTGNRMQNNQPTSHQMNVNYVEHDNSISIYAELPGIEKSDISIILYNNRLIIRAEKKKPYELVENKTESISEIKYGLLERVIILPINVTRKETVRSSYINGVLQIQINKLIEEENRFEIHPE